MAELRNKEMATFSDHNRLFFLPDGEPVWVGHGACYHVRPLLSWAVFGLYLTFLHILSGFEKQAQSD